MSVRTVQLSDEYVTFLLMLLRNSTRPMTTKELAEALRSRLGSAA